MRSRASYKQIPHYGFLGSRNSGYRHVAKLSQAQREAVFEELTNDPDICAGPQQDVCICWSLGFRVWGLLWLVEVVVVMLQLLLLLQVALGVGQKP